MSGGGREKPDASLNASLGTLNPHHILMNSRSPLQLASLVLAFFVFISTGAAKEWQTFSPAGGGFSIELPDTPSKSDTSDSTILGSINEKLATSRYESDTYSVEYQQLPDAAVVLGGKSEIFDDAKRRLLENAGSSETSWTTTSIDGHPAKVLEYSGNGTKGKAMFILVGNTFYVLDARGADLSGADMEKFFDSFQLN